MYEYCATLPDLGIGRKEGASSPTMRTQKGPRHLGMPGPGDRRRGAPISSAWVLRPSQGDELINSQVRGVAAALGHSREG